MVRKCCVPECSSTPTTPSHKFPKEKQRQEEWLDVLKEANINVNEIHKLRVCYKHFVENDYTCNPRLRILKSTAIPFIKKHDPQIYCEEQQQNNDVLIQLERHEAEIFKNQEVLSLHSEEILQTRLTMEQNIKKIQEQLDEHIKATCKSRPEL
ncbi:hypothetical protein ABEB36_013644 [Hypothenemus hampei]|uniref:THAP-type domain-containing protein n=1 Tax=Hypothenemus hampei TaxID=57062 RepID=A0ABD1E4V0_HYPHA